MVSSSQIREYLALYLASELSLGQFEDWFIPNTRDIRKTHSEAAIAITFDVEGVLSEYLSRILNESEFRHELARILQAENKEFEIRDTPQFVYSFKTSAPAKSLLLTV